jgi:hypothetical protein
LARLSYSDEWTMDSVKESKAHNLCQDVDSTFGFLEESSLHLHPQLVRTLQPHHHTLRQILNRDIFLASKELLLAPSKRPHGLRLQRDPVLMAVSKLPHQVRQRIHVLEILPCHERLRRPELYDTVRVQIFAWLAGAGEGVRVDDLLGSGKVVEGEVLHAGAFFQDRAIVLLFAELQREDIGVGCCGCDHQLRRIWRRASVGVGGEREFNLHFSIL